MFIAALFMIAPNLKQPNCPSTGEWMNTQTVIYSYSTIVRNELQVTKQMDET